MLDNFWLGCKISSYNYSQNDEDIQTWCRGADLHRIWWDPCQIIAEKKITKHGDKQCCVKNIFCLGAISNGESVE